MKAQVVGDRGRCVKYHPFRTHDQSKAVEGLQETKLKLAPRYVHVIKVEKVEKYKQFWRQLSATSPVLWSVLITLVIPAFRLFMTICSRSQVRR